MTSLEDKLLQYVLYLIGVIVAMLGVTRFKGIFSNPGNGKSSSTNSSGVMTRNEHSQVCRAVVAETKLMILDVLRDQAREIKGHVDQRVEDLKTSISSAVGPKT